MAVLFKEGNKRLEFDIAGYEFPLQKNSDCFDANWLTVKIKYEDDDFSEEYTDNCLLTDEFEKMLADIKNILEGKENGTISSFTEPSLKFSLARIESLYALQIHFVCSTEEWKELSVTQTLSEDEMRAVYEELDLLSKRFPYRNVGAESEKIEIIKGTDGPTAVYIKESKMTLKQKIKNTLSALLNKQIDIPKKKEPVSDEQVKTDFLWEQWRLEKVPEPYNTLMTYLSEIKYGGHTRFFINVAYCGEVEKAVERIGKELPEILRENLKTAYSYYVILVNEENEETEKKIIECDKFFDENEHLITEILQQYAETLR